MIVLVLPEKTIVNFNIPQYRVPYLNHLNLTSKSLRASHNAQNFHNMRNVSIFLNNWHYIINFAIIEIWNINLVFEFLFSDCTVDIVFILLSPLLLLEDPKSKCISFNHPLGSFHLLIFLLYQNLLLSVLSYKFYLLLHFLEILVYELGLAFNH